MTAAVEVRDLRITYGDRVAVDGMAFEVRPGTVTAVLGPNGAGKTTTIETCEGFRRPWSGSVRVLGLDPRADARALRPRVGVMLQSGGVYPGARALEMLEHVASLYARPQRPRELAERLGVARLGRTPYRRMSGGEKQRLAFALAVVGRPELVFLDEPSAGLDPQGRLAVWGVVEELRRDGVTVVLTTHLMDEAERLADEVVIVDHGKVVAQGATADLTCRRQRPDDHLPRPGAPPAGLPAVRPSGRVRGGRGARRPLPDRRLGRPGPAGGGHRLVRRSTASCRASSPIGRRTLEDVFLDLTGRELRA